MIRCLEYGGIYTALILPLRSFLGFLLLKFEAVVRADFPECRVETFGVANVLQ